MTRQETGVPYGTPCRAYPALYALKLKLARKFSSIFASRNSLRKPRELLTLTEKASPADSDWNQAAYESDESWKARSEPASPARQEPYAEWKYSLLSSQTNSEAYSRAYGLIRQSIYAYGRANYPRECNEMWDDVCDVNLEQCEMGRMFGREGFATRGITPTLQEEFVHAFVNLAQLRHRVAHPETPGRGHNMVPYVAKHISYAKVVAKLLKDDSTVQKLEELLGELCAAAHAQREFIETHATLAGLPEPVANWPRETERLFQYVIDMHIYHTAYSGEPSRKEEAHECEKWNKWNQIPLVIRNAALDWSEVYEAPGRMK